MDLPAALAPLDQRSQNEDDMQQAGMTQLQQHLQIKAVTKAVREERRKARGTSGGRKSKKQRTRATAGAVEPSKAVA